MVKSIQTKINIFEIINIMILCIISFTTIYPFINMAIISISPIEDIMRDSLVLIPNRITFESYKHVFMHGGMSNAYKVTIFITLMGTLVNLVMSTLGAYVLSNKSVPGRNHLMTMVIITMLFNGGLIPHYLVVKQLGLIDSLWALMIPNALNTFNMILMRNFFQSIPPSLAESARIDGCSEYKILYSIIIPLSTPIIATLALFYGVGHWNEYFNAIIYINQNKLRPLQVLIRAMYQTTTDVIMDAEALPPPTETIRSATVMIATIPILCLYPFLQKYFVHGIMVGALKG